MSILSKIRKPTLILNEEKAKRNLHNLNEKIISQKKIFRPHFKTHQSAQIGEWFRDIGISKITVSSIDMAQYFAEHGWSDILIAFPVNILQIEEIVQLSNKIQLSLLFEDLSTVAFINKFLKTDIQGWIKIDTGANRCGLKSGQLQEILSLVNMIKKSDHIKFSGLLTHAGHSYHYSSKPEITDVYKQSVDDLIGIKEFLESRGIDDIKISVGDTPSASLVDDFGPVDELRPGNFLFYDVQQYQAGVCRLEEIAVAVACPVVAIHPDRNELVIYGGAIHLSKDGHRWVEKISSYGLVTLPNNHGWSDENVIGYVRSISQEHGIVVFPDGIPADLKPGSLVYILPAHSCLTVQALGHYLSLDGEIIQTLRS